VRFPGVAALVLGTILLAGCGTGRAISGGDVSNGKTVFKNTCGACHTLNDAGTSGTVGPNLDAAFASDRAQDFAESTIRQVVADQIQYPGNYGTDGPTMPAHLVKGHDVADVAAYVASVAGVGGPTATTGATAAPSAPSTSTQKTTPTAPPAAGAGASLAAGKTAFSANGCSSCHTLKAAGATGKVGPDLDKLKSYAQKAGMPLDAFIRESIVKPNAYVEKGFPPNLMPQTFSSLPKTTLDALVKFLSASATS
jgi:cytochrome c2